MVGGSLRLTRHLATTPVIILRGLGGPTADAPPRECNRSRAPRRTAAGGLFLSWQARVRTGEGSKGRPDTQRRGSCRVLTKLRHPRLPLRPPSSAPAIRVCTAGGRGGGECPPIRSCLALRQGPGRCVTLRHPPRLDRLVAAPGGLLHGPQVAPGCTESPNHPRV